MNICDDRRRVLDEQGHTLVTGGPGSGKTTLALKKAAVRIEHGLLGGQSILFLSFSRAAVARVVESAEEWMDKDAISRVSVQTFHSFFWSILKTHSYLLGTPKKLSILLPHDEKSLSKGIKPDADNWGDWEQERNRLYRSEGRIAFDLFSSSALELLSRSEKLKSLLSKRFPMIIIDEAQDTDEEQWACVRELATSSQLICLADLDQQIYDFREGVTAERVTEIMDYLTPLRIDLGEQNNRSPDSEILRCGNDILLSAPKQDAYNGVSQQLFAPTRQGRDSAIRSSVGRVYREVFDATGEKLESVAILTRTNRGVKVVVNALRGDENQKEIPHKILFDETQALLSSRIIAFLLEPKSSPNLSVDKATFLELLSDVYLAKGTNTGLASANRWMGYAHSLRTDGKCRSTRFTQEVDHIFSQLLEHSFEGNPRKDWMFLRKLLRGQANSDLASVDRAVEYLMAFNRGKAISSNLANSWQSFGSYQSARIIVNNALTQEQLVSDNSDSKGIHVMTMHKSKGKQFDAVILLHESRICSFISYDDVAPFTKSRKLLRVAVTRAKKHVWFLTDAYNPSELLRGFNL